MIEPCFNELSLQPFCSTQEEADLRIADFIKLLKELEQFGIRRTRYETDFTAIHLLDKDNYSLYNYCRNPKNKNQELFLYSHMRRPYMDEKDEDMFYSYSDCKFITDDNKELDCIGLYVSHITKSFSVGFNVGLFEGDRHVECSLSLTKKDAEEESAIVCCLTLPQHIDNDLFVELMSEQTDLPVPCCTIEPKDKRIHLSEHHGNDECKRHAKKLIEYKYVKEILNTIDFDPSGKSYIHKIDDKNLIEIRLVNTKAGYGLCISTTAANKIQNHWIAKYLEKKFRF
ncbi:hypothetical protein HMPREF1554_01864 [Porphyromonas gingivalis F0569]|uniref:hypothetical protein n=1 Tax=Porphyromonas gingivalis TaxID=837 RepID=UPI0003AD080A|nr:hypothetical protein [Porphyromonas gingivalis]ERJ65011.1 hypothetical protein HMPREF1554_01864 [Porphyromonas gingivalis F0569]OWR80265.1 hypothetical protein SJDPG11_03805 [Porphyromonas gingivalis SJD11]